MTITAKIIADSINSDGDRITTFELEYPRFIHSEVMTHRLFSRNAASSRAIPVNKMLDVIRENPAMPIHWGKNQPGMQAKEECTTPIHIGDTLDGEPILISSEDAWREAMYRAIEMATSFNDSGYHKQVVNRILEPFSHIKVVCTATDYDNFFNLRCHPDAQPEIMDLALKMHEAYVISTPVQLYCQSELALSDDIKPTWHMPYYRDGWWSEDCPESLQEALAISSSCCAQVSYRTLDDSLNKAKRIFDKLIESKPAHASPMEHQAKCSLLANRLHVDTLSKIAVEGVTGVKLQGTKYKFTSGNFTNWIQHRQLIPDNTCWSYDNG